MADPVVGAWGVVATQPFAVTWRGDAVPLAASFMISQDVPWNLIAPPTTVASMQAIAHIGPGDQDCGLGLQSGGSIGIAVAAPQGSDAQTTEECFEMEWLSAFVGLTGSVGWCSVFA